MKFILTARAFILPAIGAILLLIQYWVPEVRLLAVVLNAVAMLLILVDYFMIPDPSRFSFSRVLPEHLFLHIEADIELHLKYRSEMPLNVYLVDTPPGIVHADIVVKEQKLLRGEGELVMNYTVRPIKRGMDTFGKAGIRISTQLGFLYRQFSIEVEDSIKVYPSLITETEELNSQYYTAQFESRLSKRYDVGREFSQVREYRRGDDMRTVHWKKSARTGKLVVKEYEPEKGQNVFLCIDGGRLMMAESEGKSKVDWAVSASLALTREALSKKDSVGIALFNDSVSTWLKPSNKKTQISAITHAVYDFQPKFIEPDYETIFNRINHQLRQRSMIIIYTDFIDPYLSSTLGTYIKHLSSRHRIICCTMSINDLKKIAYANTTTLKDAVTNSVLRESIDNRKQVLEDLRRHGVDVIDVEPHELSNAVLNGYIRARWR